MPANLKAELEEFNRFVSERLSDDQSLSLEDAVEMWREDSTTAEEFEEEVAAINQALADIDAGIKGMSIEDFDRQFRERNGLNPRQ